MPLICVVEDDPDILEIESYALKQEGYQVRTFADAGSFMEQIFSNVPDLIVLDLMLPDMNGIEILQQLKTHLSTREVPVVVVSALDDAIHAVRSFNYGASDYIRKPFPVREFLTRIGRFLKKREKDVYDLDGLCVSISERRALIDDKPVQLTSIEFDLLSFLMRNAGVVLDKKDHGKSLGL